MKNIYILSGLLMLIPFPSLVMAQSLIQNSNVIVSVSDGTIDGFYRTQDSRMVCGISSGNSYAFTRQQVGASHTLRVARFSVTGGPGIGSTITSTAMTGAANSLPRSIADFTVVGSDPYPGSGVNKDTIYIFGGGRGPNLSGYSNAFFIYDATGFHDGNGGAVTTTSVDTLLPFAKRAAMGSANLGNDQILLFGGRNNSSVFDDVVIFNRNTKMLSARSSIPVGLHSARALSAGGAGGISYVYVVGGSEIHGADSTNRKIYRYDLSADKWIVVQDSSGIDISIPGTRALEISSVQGAMLILTQSENGSSMEVYKLTHPTVIDLAAGKGKGAVLTRKSILIPTRSRDGFALSRCSPDAWVIGGAYGHGPTSSNRGLYVDLLTRW